MMMCTVLMDSIPLPPYVDNLHVDLHCSNAVITCSNGTEEHGNKESTVHVLLQSKHCVVLHFDTAVLMLFSCESPTLVAN